MGLNAVPEAAAASSPPGARGQATRSAAVDLVRAVLRHHRPLDEALVEHPELGGFDPRDRAHVRATVGTVLRRLGQIDGILAGHVRRPLPQHASVVWDVLRVGTAQIAFMGVPAHAAVDTAVSLTGALGHKGLKGLVNAVLRRVGSAGPAATGTDTVETSAGRVNTPSWLYDGWVAAYGEAVADAIARAHLADAPLDLTLRPGEDAEAWAEALEAERLPTGTLRRRLGGVVSELPGYATGEWWVQDAAAALPVLLLGEVRGRRVFDLAAAPGGKAAQLAAAGALVTAVDRSAKRMRRLEENFVRLRLSLAETVVADAASWRPAEPADAVLLDAPCSATGTIRRHPDVPYLKSQSDVRRLTAVQDQLLAAAVAMTRPGGLVVYACCSLQPEEGRDRIEAAIAGGLPVTREPILAAEVGGLAELITEAGDLRTLPCHLSETGGMDGFFAARLRRTP